MRNIDEEQTRLLRDVCAHSEKVSADLIAVAVMKPKVAIAAALGMEDLGKDIPLDEMGFISANLFPEFQQLLRGLSPLLVEHD